MTHRSNVLAALALTLVSACGPDLIRDDAGDGDETGSDTGASGEAASLLTIDEDEGTIDALVEVSVAPGSEGQRTVLCADLELPPDFPPDTNFTSLAWADAQLYASAQRQTWGDTLVRIDPCNCTVTEVGAYGFELVSGLASTAAGALYGIAAEGDVLITIDPQTANAEPQTTLGEDWLSNALSAPAPGSERFYGLNAETDHLHAFATSDAQALELIELDTDFAAAGLEYHPTRARLYACGVRDQTTDLVAIDPETGAVSTIAEAVFTTTCDNLALSEDLSCPD